MKRHDPTLVFNKAANWVAANVSQREFRNLLFCSATHGEGTTTAVLAIAALLNTRFKLRTLAVELCWREPEFAKRLGVPAETTLADFARGECAAADCVHSSPVGVPFVPVSKADNAVGFPDSGTVLERLMAELADDFDCILFDGPALVDNPDTLSSAEAVSRAMLVVESARTRSEVVQFAERQMVMSRAQLVGALLTKQKYLIPEWIYRRIVR